MDQDTQTVDTRTYTQVVIPSVSPDDIARLAQMIRDDGGTVTGDDVGLAENSCFSAKFRYDEAASSLTIDPLRLVPGLRRGNRLRAMVQRMLAPPPEPVTLESGETIHKPTPHSCATYNWAIGFITNNSGGTLTYSGQHTGHGNIQDVVNKIDNGTTPDDHKDGFWTNKSPKDSGLGCAGSISYQLADGVTTMTINYNVNTLSTKSASVALSGQNAARYTADCTLYDEFDDAAAYIYPYVTLATA